MAHSQIVDLAGFQPFGRTTAAGDPRLDESILTEIMNDAHTTQALSVGPHHCRFWGGNDCFMGCSEVIWALIQLPERSEKSELISSGIV